MNFVRTGFLLSLISGVVVALPARAGTVTDAQGNVGFDTAAECDAAVRAGTARFYEPHTTRPPQRRRGEVSVRSGTVADLGPTYRLGACDPGVGRAGGRNGVSRALRGKYVAYRPDPAAQPVPARGRADRARQHATL